MWLLERAGHQALCNVMCCAIGVGYHEGRCVCIAGEERCRIIRKALWGGGCRFWYLKGKD